MNDSDRRPPPRAPDRPTKRPPRSHAEPSAQGTPPIPDAAPMKTEALSLEDIEDIALLLDESEDRLSEPDPADESLPSSRRPPDEPIRKLPTIGRFGPYAIVGRLAIGGMAEILLAREESEGAGGRYLVVKRILAEYEKDPAFLEMFLDEARVMMRLQHPNVTHVYKFGQQDGTHFIAMEYVNGASLGKLIRKARTSGGVPVFVACKIIAFVAEALDHAHMALNEDGTPLEIVHRDVTPDNIMISYNGAVKLLDFGIAKAATRAHKTQAGVVKGKFAYMAPEQCRAKNLDHRVDVFALGICLYEAITGRPLYRRETEFETMEAIVRGAVPKLADRVKNPPPELEEIIARCIAKNPDDRYETAGELQEALDGFIASRGKVVTARKVKVLMSKLFAAEMRRGPTVDTTPFGSSFHMGSDVGALLRFSTGDGDALPDLPVPDIPLIADPFSTGAQPPGLQPPGSEPLAPTDARPGLPGTLSERAGRALYQPAEGPVGRHPLAGDRRALPTAPKVGRATRPEPRASGGGAKHAVLAVVGLLVVLGGGFAAYTLFGADEEGQTAENRDPVTRVLTGTLLLDSTPSGATVWIDDVERGTTPIIASDLSTGSHRVRLVLDGYVEHNGTAEIRAGETADLNQTLESEAPQESGPVETGRLSLTSEPPATVYFDGTSLGTTPLRDVELPAGVVALELETPDGERHRRGVLVTADDHTSAHLDLTQ